MACSWISPIVGLSRLPPLSSAPLLCQLYAVLITPFILMTPQILCSLNHVPSQLCVDSVICPLDHICTQLCALSIMFLPYSLIYMTPQLSTLLSYPMQVTSSFLFAASFNGSHDSDLSCHAIPMPRQQNMPQNQRIHVAGWVRHPYSGLPGTTSASPSNISPVFPVKPADSLQNCSLQPSKIPPA